MKLVKATFKNYRLLRDVTMEFSTDAKKKLTVIRADNGTGKTTAMSGLIWGLYGSKVVKEKIYPLSLFEAGERSIDIEVQIQFEAESVLTKQGKTIVENKTYKLTRKCTEKVDLDGSKFSRTADNVRLYECLPEGDQPKLQSEIDMIIERSLPRHLKDIYFTDGDKALTFIESTASEGEKRKRVRTAIESLLSMRELEAVIKNLRAVKLAYARKIDKSDYVKKLIEVEESIDNNELWISDAEKEIEGNIEQKVEAEEHISSTKKRIEEQLKLGDKVALSNEIKDLERQQKRALDLKSESIKSLCKLLNSNDLASSLISSKLAPAIEMLNDMKARDNFPKQFIPVLNDILGRGECLCGEDVSLETADGKKKRVYIESVIEDCREVDLLNSRASDLYYASDKYTLSKGESSWKSEYDSLTKQYFTADASQRSNAATLQKKQAIVDDINDDVLRELREFQKTNELKLQGLNNAITLAQSEISRFSEKNVGLKKELETYSLKVGKKNDAGGKHSLTEELIKIYTSVFERIKNQELEKVSAQMNNIFLSMIGGDSNIDPKGMIRRSELTKDFDIKVFGPNDQPLNPDTELNGASRRAISLSFILALTKVSNVEAANVIDTPLGMTSGLVKASILKNLVEQGSQIIMFLTFDEIKGVEPLLDEYTGSSMTMSFSGHFPRMLANKPAHDGETNICKCSHRECCNVCERIDQPNMKQRLQ